MPIILDASVALKLIVLEDGTEEARTLLLREEEVVAPDWMLAEVANGLINKIRFAALHPDIATVNLEQMPLFIDRWVPSEPLLKKAILLAAELGHALYDCLYLQVAIDEEGVLVTADDGFMAAVGTTTYTQYVERLTW